MAVLRLGPPRRASAAACCCSTTTDAEKKEFGDFSLKALPWWSSDRRRPWYIRADSEETLKKWISTFEFAARKAGPPLNPDPVMRRAFEAAYLETRWVLDEWDWYYLARTEAEQARRGAGRGQQRRSWPDPPLFPALPPAPTQLGCLVVDRCERTCMRPVYAKIPSGAMESVVRGQVVKVLDQTVGAAVGAGWKAVSATVDANKAKVKEAVDANIGSVLEKQVEVKDRITGAILSSLQALVDKARSKMGGKGEQPQPPRPLPPRARARRTRRPSSAPSSACSRSRSSRRTVRPRASSWRTWARPSRRRPRRRRPPTPRRRGRRASATSRTRRSGTGAASTRPSPRRVVGRWGRSRETPESLTPLPPHRRSATSRSTTPASPRTRPSASRSPSTRSRACSGASRSGRCAAEVEHAWGGARPPQQRPPSAPPAQIERQFEEGIRELSRNAVYTLKTRSESQGTEAKSEGEGELCRDAAAPLP